MHITYCVYIKKKKAFHIIFFTPSRIHQSRNGEYFKLYPNSDFYLNETDQQCIGFGETLLDYCREFAKNPPAAIS